MCNAQRRREALLHPISLVRVPQGIDPPTAHTIFEVSWLCRNKHEVTSTSKAYPKENTPMRLTKRSLIKTAAVGSVFVGALALAAPASANSFGPTDYGTDGNAIVSYNDASDQFCVTENSGWYRGYINVRLYPETNSRGPSYNFDVYAGDTKCVSLERAFEDSYYYYKVGDGSPVNFYS